MKPRRYIFIVLAIIFVSLLLGACYRSVPHYKTWVANQQAGTNSNLQETYLVDQSLVTPTADTWTPFPDEPTATITPTVFATKMPPTPIPEISITLAPDAPSPTPNAAIELPLLRSEPYTYTFQEGDTIENIAFKNQVSLNQIQAANPYTDIRALVPGLEILIPSAAENELAPAFKIIPDNEVFYGPGVKNFNTAAVIKYFGGFLNNYVEQVNDTGDMTAYEIVQRVADENSVNPRLLLALIEYRSGWLTHTDDGASFTDYPLGYRNPKKTGLYQQLSWVGSMLIAGSTGMRSSALSAWSLPDSTVYRIDPTINSGTAAIQYLFSGMMDQDEWLEAVSEQGFYQTYLNLFGDPFSFDNGPILPEGLTQPEFTLPFPSGTYWYLTSGPHYGWGVGSPWAALDFAPADADFCHVSLTPVTAIAEGDIVRSSNWGVVLDLDGDMNEHTGWNIFYMHTTIDKRIPYGAHVKVGDVIGYASCEGGVSSGTHVHIARKYNGVWINAGGDIPFVMDGWTAYSGARSYDGGLQKGNEIIEAYGAKGEYNIIWRDR